MLEELGFLWIEEPTQKAGPEAIENYLKAADLVREQDVVDQVNRVYDEIQDGLNLHPDARDFIVGFARDVTIQAIPTIDGQGQPDQEPGIAQGQTHRLRPPRSAGVRARSARWDPRSATRGRPTSTRTWSTCARCATPKIWAASVPEKCWCAMPWTRT